MDKPATSSAANRWAVPDVESFLRECWQKEARLFRQALPGFDAPLDANDLAGLACEAEVESRIILEHGGEKPWQLEHGPFAEERFTTLPERDWTLLVQDVDKHYPPVAEVLKHFRFIPDWRIDDIMISYAPPGGSVGPHYDLYDVFLLQVAGERHWQWGEVDAEPEWQDSELRILANFAPQHSATLQPGDMLYVPPGVAHHGVATSDCVTWSIGFRAPSAAELLSDFSDQLIQELDDSKRYNDQFASRLPQALQGQHGVLDADTVDNATQLIQQQLAQSLNDKNWATRWFGAMQTSPKAWLQPVPADDSVIQQWQGKPLAVQRHTGSRWAMSPEQNLLFVGGDIYQLTGETAALGEYLSNHIDYQQRDLLPLVAADAALELLGLLISSGNLLPN